MRDPFPIPPPQWLVSAIKPTADYLDMYTFPLHAHEVVFAFVLYSGIYLGVSPVLSRTFAPDKYARLTRRTRISWDVHVVSFVQSLIISALSLYIIVFDQERKSWRSSALAIDGDWEMRMWGYSGLSGLCQSMALGYFMWDFVMCSYHVKIFGWGMLAHAVSAVSVFALGYRPFLYFYCPVFLLYELSSPFLNIHWFCDKLDLTGSAIQAVNGAFLTATFFLCRIVWGSYSSVHAFGDMYAAISRGHYTRPVLTGKMPGNADSGDISLYYDQQRQTNAFVNEGFIPIWLASTYFASNLVLNLLNWWWFSKMVSTIRNRFPPPFGTKGVHEVKDYYAIDTAMQGAKDLKDGVVEKAGGIKQAKKRVEEVMGETFVERGIDANGRKSVEVTGVTKRSTRSRRKA